MWDGVIIADWMDSGFCGGIVRLFVGEECQDCDNYNCKRE